MKGPGRVRLVGTVIEASVVERGDATFEDVRDRVTGHLKFTIDRVNWFSTYHVHHRVAAKLPAGARIPARETPPTSTARSAARG